MRLIDHIRNFGDVSESHPHVRSSHRQTRITRPASEFNNQMLHKVLRISSEHHPSPARIGATNLCYLGNASDSRRSDPTVAFVSGPLPREASRHY